MASVTESESSRVACPHESPYPSKHNLVIDAEIGMTQVSLCK